MALGFTVNAQGNFGIAQHVMDSLSDAETQNPKTPNPKPKIPKPGHRHAGVAEQAGPALARPLLTSTVPIGAPVSCKMDHALPDWFDRVLAPVPYQHTSEEGSLVLEGRARCVQRSLCAASALSEQVVEQALRCGAFPCAG